MLREIKEKLLVPIVGGDVAARPPSEALPNVADGAPVPRIEANALVPDAEAGGGLLEEASTSSKNESFDLSSCDKSIKSATSRTCAAFGSGFGFGSDFDFVGVFFARSTCGELDGDEIEDFFRADPSFFRETLTFFRPDSDLVLDNDLVLLISADSSYQSFFSYFFRMKVSTALLSDDGVGLALRGIVASYFELTTSLPPWRTKRLK